MNIKIIGGGPIGCYSAALLSKNHDVTIYEEDKEVGKPVRCTGILSNTINEITPLKKTFIANKIYSTRIFAPNNKFITINFKKPNIVIKRDKFDQHFKDKAEENGAKIIYNHRYTEKNNIKDLNNKRTKKLIFDKLIGADGPVSKVSKTHNLGVREYLQGVQAIIKKKNDNTVDFYPHIGVYAWAVPESEEYLRVGVAGRTNTIKTFKEFLKKYNGEIIKWQSGLIPIHNPKNKTTNKNVYLVGDAAAQIKNTTGGGLIPGLMAAEELAKAINQNKEYEKLWRKRIGKQLWTHYYIRKTINKFKKEDWNKLIEITNKESTKKILATESRDEPIKLVTKAIMTNPSILIFLKKLF